jgi:hypothetical protein
MNRSKISTLPDIEVFELLPKEKPDETLIDGIPEGLENGIGKSRQSGHNVILASLPINALKHHPKLATPSIVDGIRKLMAMFANENPGNGYYCEKRGRIDGNKIFLCRHRRQRD